MTVPTPTAGNHRPPLATWVAGARPRTLPASMAPVLVGTGVALFGEGFSGPRALLALVVALALQVGVNYANDYSDGIRGTDAARVGPVRLVGQALAAPRSVKRAAFASFGVAAIAGLVLVVLSQQWVMLAVGAAAIGAAWTYTGGPRPYGYAGLGELFVFVFFGLVAVCGTVLTQLGELPALAWLAATGVGLLSCAILVANNLRDIPGDTQSGKRTLAVRLGEARTRTLYLTLLFCALAIPLLTTLLALTTADGWPRWGWLGAAAALPAIPPARAVRTGGTGRDLIPALGGTGRAMLAYGMLFGAGIALS